MQTWWIGRSRQGLVGKDYRNSCQGRQVMTVAALWLFPRVGIEHLVPMKTQEWALVDPDSDMMHGQRYEQGRHGLCRIYRN